MVLQQIRQPADLRELGYPELDEVAGEIRDFIVHAVSENAGHLGSNLGVVELTLALHRVFESPTDAILWDTGHQAYVHKIVTGRQAGFEHLRQAGGLSGYPNREESPHDHIENSHASTVLSYAYGLAVGRDLGSNQLRHIVAVIGDGSMTGGMAYEALNNIGHSRQRVIIVLNDNGRSYAPTISNLSAAGTQGERAALDHPSLPERITEKLAHGLTNIRLNPVYVRRQRRLEQFLRDLPYVGSQAEKSMEAFKAAVREFLQPPSFFEALGARYVGPVDGHDVCELEETFRNAIELSAEGPIVVHVLTQKGKGYSPAEDDDEKHLHDAPVFDPAVGPPAAVVTGYTQAFADAIIKEAELDPRLQNAIELSAEGPIVVHVLTQKGKGYSPAEDDDEKHLHDAPVFDPAVGPPPAVVTGYTQAFADAVIKEAELDSRVVAITAAMPGPTGLLPFQSHFPSRFFDVGIAEQHAVTGAAGMAMGGLRPVVAIYSTFLNRAWDQVVYDVALHRLPVVFCLDRAGVTGPDGASHHGVYDMALLSKVPGMRVLAPSSAEELAVMLHDAMSLADEGPVALRWPRGTAHHVAEHEVGSGLRARKVRGGDGSVAVLAVGKMLVDAQKAADSLSSAGIDVTVWDVRSCAPLDDEMIRDAAGHRAVVTIEDGIREGGIGMAIADHVHAVASTVPVTVLGIPTRFVPHGTADRILAQMGLDADGIAAAVRALLA